MYTSIGLLVLVVGIIAKGQCFLLGPETFNSSSYCAQLGCDQKGTFTQDSHVLPIEGKKFVVWHSYSPSVAPLTQTDENYGCVGNSDVIVCPYHDNPHGKSRHIMLNPETAEEYDTSSYETLTSIGTPVLTKETHVFGINGSHASLVDPVGKMSVLIALPAKLFPNGFFSPVYLADANIVIVVGNQSKDIVIFGVGKDAKTGKPVLVLLNTFNILNKTPCPWLTITEPVARGDRVYLYGFRDEDETTGLLAIDIMIESPYWKFAWELVDNPSKEGLIKCPTDLPVNPDIDLATQMIATPDNFVVVTLPVAVLVIKDDGDSAKVNDTMIIFGATHFVSLDNSPTRSSAGRGPNVWATAWPQEDIYNGNLVGLDYSKGYNGLKFLTIDGYLNATQFDATSRIMTYPHPQRKDKSVLVFGARLTVTNATSVFFSKFCSDCKVGVSRVVMGVVGSAGSTSTPEILWISKIPDLGYNLEAKGQIIGVTGKLIMYVTDGKMGYVMALK